MAAQITGSPRSMFAPGTLKLREPRLQGNVPRIPKPKAPRMIQALKGPKAGPVPLRSLVRAGIPR